MIMAVQHAQERTHTHTHNGNRFHYNDIYCDYFHVKCHNSKSICLRFGARSVHCACTGNDNDDDGDDDAFYGKSIKDEHANRLNTLDSIHTHTHTLIHLHNWLSFFRHYILVKICTKHTSIVKYLHRHFAYHSYVFCVLAQILWLNHVEI